MRTFHISRAEVKNGSIVCPSCDDTQEYINDDTATGTFSCEGCGNPFIVDQLLLEKRYEFDVEDVKNEFEKLEKRIKRLEKELGIK